MRYSILFVVVLILLSGFVAYFGDLLGRKMGKKRLTLFHMRPRYTAILFTVITGMVIAAIALGALVSANKQFRKVLIEGDAILSQNSFLKRTNRDLDRQNNELTDKGKALTLEADQRIKDADIARKEAAKFLQARNEAQLTVHKLEADIAVRKTELENLKKNSKVTKAMLQESIAQLNNVRNALLIAKSRFEQFASASIDLRSGILILRQGDEITRGVVHTNQSSVAIRSDLRTLLQVASDRALKMGAAKGANSRAVSVMFRRKISDSLDYLERNETLFIKQAADTILKASPHDQVLVQVMCARNTLKDEQVPVELKLYPNDVIFRENQKIADGRIDGRQSEGRILMDLIAFLQSAVGRTGLQAGIVPVSGASSRTGSEPNPLGQVEALMGTADKVKTLNSSVSITVYAGRDIRAEGPLNMDNMRVDVRRL